MVNYYYIGGALIAGLANLITYPIFIFILLTATIITAGLIYYFSSDKSNYYIWLISIILGGISWIMIIILFFVIGFTKKSKSLIISTNVLYSLTLILLIASIILMSINAFVYKKSNINNNEFICVIIFTTLGIITLVNIILNLILFNTTIVPLLKKEEIQQYIENINNKSNQNETLFDPNSPLPSDLTQAEINYINNNKIIK